MGVLVNELDNSFATNIASPLTEGRSPDQLVSDLAADPRGGFRRPPCGVMPDQLVWEPTGGGPGVLAQTSISRTEQPSDAWLTPTALVVDDSGSHAVYYYSGFLS